MDPLQILNDLQKNVFNQIATDVGPKLWQFGFSLLSSLTIIMTVFAGIKIMNGDHQAFQRLRNFTGVVLLLWIIMQGYTNNIALLGNTSFAKMIPEYANGLAAKIDSDTEKTLVTTLTNSYNAMVGDGKSTLDIIWNLGGVITALFIMALIAILQLAMFLVIAFGQLSLGVVIGIGPILIPFLLVPKLDFLFWGWLRSLIKYSFYPVVAKLFLSVVCKLLLFLINPLVGSGAAVAGITLARGFVLDAFLLVGIYGVFKIPILVNDIFNGAASAGNLSQVAQQATSAVRGAIAIA